MKSERRIKMLVNQVKLDDEDRIDVAFWLNKSPAERLAEVTRLRHNYFKWADGSFPETIAKVAQVRPL